MTWWFYFFLYSWQGDDLQRTGREIIGQQVRKEWSSWKWERKLIKNKELLGRVEG